MSRWIRRISLASLAVLLLIELFASYDTAVRQVALAVSNIAAAAALLLISRGLNKRGIELPAAVTLLVALAVWFDAAGNFAHWYGRFTWWDQLSHTIGTAAIAPALIAITLALQRQGKINLPAWLHWIFAVSVATALAALYEVSELVGDELFNTHRITDLYDTADDLRFNIAAAALAALIALKIMSRLTKIHVDITAKNQ